MRPTSALVILALSAGCTSAVAQQAQEFPDVCFEQAEMARAGTTDGRSISIQCPAGDGAGYGAVASPIAAPPATAAAPLEFRTAPSGSTSQIATLFRNICIPHEGNFAGAITAATASGAFGAPSARPIGIGGTRTLFTTTSGTIEAIIVTNDQLGDSCAIGSMTEVYVIAPGTRVLP